MLSFDCCRAAHSSHPLSSFTAAILAASAAAFASAAVTPPNSLLATAVVSLQINCLADPTFEASGSALNYI